MLRAVGLFASVVLAGCGVSPSLSSAAGRPNIVVILADDMGIGDAGCYGATRVRTPHIDRLAREGMRFTDAHSPHSVCTPTRYGLLTGRYCWRTWARSRCVWSDDPLLVDPKRLTLPRLLKQAGYLTGCIGKWHLGFGVPGAPGWDGRLGPDYNSELKPGPLEVGFDTFYGIPHVGQRPHVFIEDHRVVGLDSADPLRLAPDPRIRGRRSFLDRPSFAPAHKFTGGKAAMYRHEDLAVALTEKGVEWIERRAREPFFLYFAHRNVHAPLRPNSRFKGTSDIGVYGDFIRELDWSVGRILDALDRKGLSRNTIVIFSSDNGAVQAGHAPADVVDYSGHRANGIYRGQKTEAYEGGHRVPLLIRWPGRVPAGATSGALVALTDLTATAADLLGHSLPHEAGEDSFSFLSVLTGAAPRGPTRNTIVHDSNRGLMAVREGSWKLILGQGGGGLGWAPGTKDPDRPSEQLYDLSRDPSERNNLYAKHPAKVAALKALLDRIRKTGRSRP